MIDEALATGDAGFRAERISEIRHHAGPCFFIGHFLTAVRATCLRGLRSGEAAVEDVTRWLAVELAPAVRVNAVARSFFVGEQNRRLLLDERGERTARRRTIIDRTPARRSVRPTS
jgi:hypothetical protein